MRNLLAFIKAYSGEESIDEQLLAARKKACARCPKMATRMAAQCECGALEGEMELLDSLFALSLTKLSETTDRIHREAIRNSRKTKGLI